jgi:hypothetical protein
MVKARELPRGRFGRQSLINQVGDILKAHRRHSCHGFKLMYDLRINAI